MELVIVYDDDELRGLIAFAVRQAGYLVVQAYDGVQALDVFER